MPLLSDRDIAYVSKSFEKLRDEVNVKLFVDSEEGEYNKKTIELLREFCAISPKLNLEVGNLAKDKERAQSFGIDKSPGILVAGKEMKEHIYYFGIPAGYQFAALIDDIVDVSTGRTRLSPATIASLQRIEKPVEISVFVSISEQLCAGAVRIAHQFAMENDKIWASMIDAEQFTELAIHNTVTRVPKIIVNGLLSVDEPLNEEDFLEHVLSATE